MLRVSRILALVGMLSACALGDVQVREIAVLGLEGNNVTQGELDALTNRLRTALFETGAFTVLERSRVDEILREQGFQQSGCTNADCAVEVGRLIGVRGIVIGSIDRVGDYASISVRVVDVETGKLLATASEDCDSCTLAVLMRTTLPRAAARLVGATSKAPVQPIAATNTVTVPTGMVALKMPSGKTLSVDKYEVTRTDYRKIMGKDPTSHSGGERLPVESVTWDEARRYCEALGKRLPTAAEWTYAAGGSDGAYLAAVRRAPEQFVWYRANSSRRTQPVGTLRSNPFGLHDMLGNVREWCIDGPEDSPGLIGRVLGSGSAVPKFAMGSFWDSRGEAAADVGTQATYDTGFENNEVGFRCVQ